MKTAADGSEAARGCCAKTPEFESASCFMVIAITEMGGRLRTGWIRRKAGSVAIWMMAGNKEIRKTGGRISG